jgi:hypothetical protein
MRTEQTRNEAVVLVSNSEGQMVTKRAAGKHFLTEAIDLVSDKLKANREREAADVKQPKSDKTLAELIAESAQDSE